MKKVHSVVEGNSLKLCWDNWVFTEKLVNLDAYLKPSMKINSKDLTKQNIKAKIINLLEENIGLNLCALSQTTFS